DFSSGNFLDGNTLTYNGAAGLNTLVLQGGTFSSETITSLGDRTSTINLDTGTIEVNNVGDDTTNPTGGIIDSTTVTDFAFHDFPQPFESFSVADGDVEAGQQMTLIRTDPQFVEFGPQPVPFIQVDFKNKTNVVVYGSQLDNTTTLANSH